MKLRSYVLNKNRLVYDKIALNIINENILHNCVKTTVAYNQFNHSQ